MCGLGQGLRRRNLRGAALRGSRVGVLCRTVRVARSGWSARPGRAEVGWRPRQPRDPAHAGVGGRGRTTGGGWGLREARTRESSRAVRGSCRCDGWGRSWVPERWTGMKPGPALVLRGLPLLLVRLGVPALALVVADVDGELRDPVPVLLVLDTSLAACLPACLPPCCPSLSCVSAACCLPVCPLFLPPPLPPRPLGNLGNTAQTGERPAVPPSPLTATPPPEWRKFARYRNSIFGYIFSESMLNCLTLTSFLRPPPVGRGGGLRNLGRNTGYVCRVEGATGGRTGYHH